jgi:hypothetical protein
MTDEIIDRMQNDLEGLLFEFKYTMERFQESILEKLRQGDMESAWNQYRKLHNLSEDNMYAIHDYWDRESQDLP